ncbi:hypothetical protein SLA2020_500870 [Shorea laevis]
MRDENPKRSKLSWSKKLVRKWFNIKSKTEDIQANDHVYGGGEAGCRTSFLEREPCTIKKSKTEKFSKSTEQGRRGRMNLDHPRIIDVQNYRPLQSMVCFTTIGGAHMQENLAFLLSGSRIPYMGTAEVNTH